MRSELDGRADGVTEAASAGMAEPRGTRHAPRISVVDMLFSFLGALFAIAGIVCLIALIDARNESAHVRDIYDECVGAATELMDASDHLTSTARLYALTGDTVYLKQYLDEICDAKRRDAAVDTLKRNAGGTRAERLLEEALDYSNELAKREFYAMRLTAESQGLQEMPEEIASVKLTADHKEMSAEKKADLGREMVIDEAYSELKGHITDSVNECFGALVDDLNAERTESLAKERQLQATLMASLIMGALLMVANEVVGHVLVLQPIRRHTLSIQGNEPLVVFGCQEIRSVAESYNRLYEENRKRTKMLRQQATTDALTGLLNRGSFDSALDHNQDDIALMVVDVDLFKMINDSGGHETGDRVLKKVGHALARQFRTTDYVCRIGGDEFAVILTEMPVEMRGVVRTKVETIMEELANTEDGLPLVTLSVGIAFGATLPESVNLYHAADEALYEAKRRGRNGYVFYERT